jgi:hypothetical protein
MMTMTELAQGLGPLLPGSCREDVADVVVRSVVMVRNADQPPKHARIEEMRTEGGSISCFPTQVVYIELSGT